MKAFSTTEERMGFVPVGSETGEGGCEGGFQLESDQK